VRKRMQLGICRKRTASAAIVFASYLSDNNTGPALLVIH
jgi:hypothetical protein